MGLRSGGKQLGIMQKHQQSITALALKVLVSLLSPCSLVGLPQDLTLHQLGESPASLYRIKDGRINLCGARIIRLEKANFLLSIISATFSMSQFPLKTFN